MKFRFNSLKAKAIVSIGAGVLMTLSVPVLASKSDKNAAQVPMTPKAVMRAAGVQIIHLGETYRLVIPSHQLFNVDSANLRVGATNLLKNVNRFINKFHIISIEVAAYSDNQNSGVRKDALISRQAEVVQSFLSDRGLTARLIYSVGKGDQSPVASNKTAAGREKNRRVEISFQYIPPTTIYESVAK